MKLLFIACLFLSVTASAQRDTTGRHARMFIGHHGKDSVRHNTIEAIFEAHADSVKTFTTADNEVTYIDTLRTEKSDHNGVFYLYIEGTTPNGHVITDTKTIVVTNRDGHNMIGHRHENYAKQWGEETAQGSFWNVGIPSGGGLICVSLTGLKNKKLVWRYLKVKE